MPVLSLALASKVIVPEMTVGTCAERMGNCVSPHGAVLNVPGLLRALLPLVSSISTR